MEAATREASQGVLPLCCGWTATVQRSYPRRRCGVFRVIEVVLLGSMMAFLRRAPEASGHVTFLLAVTCLIMVTVIIIYLAHLLPLHHHQHCPSGGHRLRYCYNLSSIMETLHDGVSSLVLLPAAILLLLYPAPSPPIAVAAVLTIVLVLLLAVQCAENLLKALQPIEPRQEDQGQEMRHVGQITPPQDSHAQLTRRYTPNTSRGRSNRQWSKTRKNPSSPLLPLSPTSLSYSVSPAPIHPGSSIHPSSRRLSSSKPLSPPPPSSHNCLRHSGSPASYEYSMSPLSRTRFVPAPVFSPPPTSTSVPQPANGSITAVPNPSSPVLSNPNTSPHLSSYSGVPLSSLSSSPPPLSHTSVLQSPHASNTYPSNLFLSRPRTSSRIPHEGVVPLSSRSSPPPLPHIFMVPSTQDPISQHPSTHDHAPLSQVQDVVLNNGYVESWHGDPPSPIINPSPCPSSTGPSPSHTHTLVPPFPTDPAIYANINHPCDTTFNISPYPSDTLTVAALTHEHTTLTTTPSSTTVKPADIPPNPDPTVSEMYATPCDIVSIYENVTPLTISTTSLAVTTSPSASSPHSPIYATILSDNTVTTTVTTASPTPTTTNPSDNARNSTSSLDYYSPVSYL